MFSPEDMGSDLHFHEMSLAKKRKFLGWVRNKMKLVAEQLTTGFTTLENDDTKDEITREATIKVLMHEILKFKNASTELAELAGSIDAKNPTEEQMEFSIGSCQFRFALVGALSVLSDIIVEDLEAGCDDVHSSN